MANVFIEESILQDWADFVREKTGTSDKMKPTELLAKTKSEWASGGGSAKKYIVPETTFSFAQSESGLYGYTTENTYQLTEGKTYKVLWDGEEFEFVYIVYTVDVGQIVPIGHALGNASFFNTYSGGLTNFEDTGEPFMIGVASDNTFAILTDEEGESHVVAVYEEKAGGSSDDVRYVTFMSEDGKTELFVKPVAVGDDCADVISRGLIDTPTKSSTAQYDFTFSGWSIYAGSNANPDALKNVTEDRIVYAAYNSALRYYTINYYDGETLLKSENLSFGSMPNYTPEKTGYGFNGWIPAMKEVTEDATYSATWVEANISIANMGWDEIAALTESGQANKFTIGDTKEFSIGNYNFVAKIIGINHDDLSDGSGKAGLTFITTPNLSTFGQHGGSSPMHTSTGTTYTWAESTVRKGYHNETSSTYILQKLDATMKNALKRVNKKYYDFNTDTIKISQDLIWVESLSELGFDSSYDEGDCYPVYTNGKSLDSSDANLIRQEQFASYASDAIWWTRCKYQSGSSTDVWYAIDKTGKPILVKPTGSAIPFGCFCI